MLLSAPEQAAGGLQAVDSLQWYVLGAVFASPYRNLLKLDLAKGGCGRTGFALCRRGTRNT